MQIKIFINPEHLKDFIDSVKCPENYNTKIEFSFRENINMNLVAETLLDVETFSAFKQKQNILKNQKK